MKEQNKTLFQRALNWTGLTPSQELKADIKRQQTSIIIIILITLVMLLLEYFGWQRPFLRIINPKFSLIPIHTNAHSRLLYAQAYTTLAFIFLFMVLPALTLFLMKTKNILDSEPLFPGLSLPKIETFRPYLLIGICMFICLLFVCASPNFYRFYPLFRPHNFLEWLTFEVIYLTQFIAVEFFFRGPLLFKLNQFFGVSSIAIMSLPYALIHIHKPFPEAIGSIIAGIVLGHLSLKSKSIWPGVLLHVFVAFCADSLGLFYGGDFTRW